MFTMFVRIAILVVMSVVGASCRDASQVLGAQANVSAAEASPQPQARCDVRVAVLQDKTRSSPGNRTPQIESADLQALVDVASVCGGEIGFSIIHPKGVQPLVRIRLDAPPAPLPVRPPSGNSLDSRRETRERVEVEAANALHESEWADEQGSRLGAFEAKVAPLLAFPVDGGRSAIWGAIRAGLAFLNEPVAPGRLQGQPAKFLAVISDGVETAGGRPLEVPADVTLIIVNGSGDAGDLESLRGTRFESIDAAFRFIGERPLPATVASPRP